MGLYSLFEFNNSAVFFMTKKGKKMSFGAYNIAKIGCYKVY